MSHYNTNLDKNNANFVPLTPLSFLQRAKDIYPNYEAIVYEDRRYTWSEVFKLPFICIEDNTYIFPTVVGTMGGSSN